MYQIIDKDGLVIEACHNLETAKKILLIRYGNDLGLTIRENPDMI
jgi:hypothetical protein